MRVLLHGAVAEADMPLHGQLEVPEADGLPCMAPGDGTAKTGSCVRSGTTCGSARWGMPRKGGDLMLCCLAKKQLRRASTMPSS